MNRRELLKLLGMGIIGHTLDVDRLLWIPGQKTIFLPTLNKKAIALNDILALEMKHLIPKLRDLFERDEFFIKH